MPLNPLAVERFRTIVTDALDPRGGSGAVDNPAASADDILAHFPEANFEYQTNAAGVRLRRVAVASPWEPDPLPAWMQDAPQSPPALGVPWSS